MVWHCSIGHQNSIGIIIYQAVFVCSSNVVVPQDSVPTAANALVDYNGTSKSLAISLHGYKPDDLYYRVGSIGFAI